MPKFFKLNLLSAPELPPQSAGEGYEDHLLPSPLDEPELPAPKPHQPLPKTLPPDLPHSDYALDKQEHDPVRTLLTWKASARPYRKKDKSYFTTIGVVILLVSMILLFAPSERILIAVLFALGFVVYVLGFVAPGEVEYKLSTQGVTIGDHFYHWDVLDSFWFCEKEGFKVLNILTNLRFPGMLILVLGDTNEEQVKRICARFLPFHEIAPKSFLDKWSEKLQKHFPLENQIR